ncbi:MAG: hypothetical protein H6727_03465 [Myxococcales bacterium]|nr:hypothetical protein [Myxococcales bacterium]
MSKKPLSPWLVVIAMLAIGVAGRLLPHPPNVAPIASVALFAGFYFSRRGMAALLPLSAMLISDLFLGVYNIRIAAVVYVAFLLPVVWGPWLRGEVTLSARWSWLRPVLGVARVAGAALAGSVAFFLLSNLAVWGFSATYPHTTEGLVACYVAALPFFHYTLLGDLAYTTVLFGGYAMALSFSQARTAQTLSA